MAYSTDINLVLGPIVIGTVLNGFIYGICFAQFLTYWNNCFKDTYIIRYLVGWTFLLDTFHSGALFYMLWAYVVTNFGNPIFLTAVLWPFSATPIVTTLTSFPIQIFLSWRIRQLSQSKKVFYCLVFMAAAQGSVGLACSISAFKVPDLALYHILVPYVDAWQVLAVATDASISILLWYHLSQSRTGQKRSDCVIQRVIRTSVETAAFGAFFCIMDLITFTVLLRTNFHVIFAFPMGRIYTNALLMNLNSRPSLRAEFEGPFIPDIALDQLSSRLCNGVLSD
ncbi:hypothetical protein CPB84DRAFT_1777556 [Gymnopilus junonius]|uniref:DUF6534 domain-containing protein n=1 Tax=Gymnopilus junonius TaxID=109634 RepID=A0A9P5NNJ5_GYMJU|nr:hypothetical protein CPB84DRAFT_1777556 [Gymnopilus junonius]